MDAKQKAQWTTALRSGEYEQGFFALRSTEGGVTKHCCLGVLLALHERQWSERSERYASFVTYGILPSTLARDLQIDSNPHPFEGLGLYTPDGVYLSEYRLSGLNDGGFTFEQIADIIDYFM